MTDECGNYSSKYNAYKEDKSFSFSNLYTKISPYKCDSGFINNYFVRVRSSVVKFEKTNNQITFKDSKGSVIFTLKP